MPNYLSDMRPNFKAHTIECGSIKAYSYRKNLKSELKAKSITAAISVVILASAMVDDAFS